MLQAECTDGEMFNYMKTVWKFSPGYPANPNTCTLDFFVSQTLQLENIVLIAPELNQNTKTNILAVVFKENQETQMF